MAGMNVEELWTKKWNVTDMPSRPLYKYTAFENTSGQFRLLHLNPSRDPADPLKGILCTYDTDWYTKVYYPEKSAIPNWTALSYVWTDDHDSDPVDLAGQKLRDPRKTEEILINGCSLMITENLFHALMLIRGYEDFCVIWCDQVCIDQSNQEERAAQISGMVNVFGLAREVLIWLGKAILTKSFKMLAEMQTFLLQGTAGLDSAPSTAKYMAKLIQNDPALHPPADQNHHLFVKQIAGQILEDPWFGRAWVIQEALGANVSVFMGMLIVPWELFYKAVSSLSFWNLPWSLEEDSALITHHRESLETIEKLRRWFNRDRGKLFNRDGGESSEGFTPEETQKAIRARDRLSPDFSTLIMSLRITQSTDPRDKVYAFYDLSHQHGKAEKGEIKSFSANYAADVKTVFAHTAAYCTNSEKTLNLMSCTCKFETQLYQADLPSWMHDFRINYSQLRCSSDLRNILPQRGCDTLAKWSEQRGKIPFCASGDRVPHCRPHSDVALFGFVGEETEWDKILLKGIVFDQVSRVTDLPCTTIPNEQTKEEADAAWTEWMQLAMIFPRTGSNPYEDFDGQFRAFYQALSFGRITIPALSEEKIRDAFLAWWNKGRPLEADSSLHDDWNQKLSEHIAIEKEVFPGALYVNNRCFFRTSRGYMGVACKHCEPGDLVCILWGGSLPYILRFRGREDGFAVTEAVGGAVCIPGIMYGEAIQIADQEGLEERDIVIA